MEFKELQKHIDAFGADIVTLVNHPRAEISDIERAKGYADKLSDMLGKSAITFARMSGQIQQKVKIMEGVQTKKELKGELKNIKKGLKEVKTLAGENATPLLKKVLSHKEVKTLAGENGVYTEYHGTNS